jgi:hypothetical protein
MRSPVRLIPRASVVLVLAALGAALAAGCQKPAKQEPSSGPGPAAAEEVRRTERLPIEDALVIAKDKMSEAGGQWVVESAQRVSDGWTFLFAKTYGEVGIGSRALVRVDDNRRVTMTPGA